MIPPPSKDAVESAKAVYVATSEAAPTLVETFETRYDAWQKTWFARANMSSSKYASLSPFSFLSA